MRLYKPDTIQQAKQDLLARLAKHPQGLRTSQLTGTDHFHGERTLTSRQVTKLLRTMPDKVVEHYDGTGYMAALWWKLKPTS